MSNLIKFLLMALIWAVFFFVTFKSCIEPEYCPDDGTGITEQVTPPPVAPAVTDDYAIMTRMGADEVVTGSLWDAERDQLLAQYKADPDRTLEIYGHYYDNEPVPEGYADMGLLRADRIKDILVKAGIPAASIETLSRKLTTERPADGELWDAGSFAWADAESEERVIEISRDEIEILFPYDENQTNLSADTESYLKRLAERLQQTNENVGIVGHTDVRGTTAYNQRLGQRRAEFVKQRLVSYGAPAARISTSSRGESQPTGISYQRDRRAILTLNRD